MKFRQWQIDKLVKIHKLFGYKSEFLRNKIDKLLELQLQARKNKGIQELPPGGFVMWGNTDD